MRVRGTPLSHALKASRPALVAAFGLSIFINLTLFASPIYSLQVYDRVLASRNLGTLLLLTLIVGLFIALYGILEYARAGVLVRAGVRFNEVLAEPLFETAMSAARNGRESAAREALRDADTVREAIAGGTVSTLFDVPWALGFVFLCYLMHPALGTVAFIAAIAIFICALAMEVVTRNGLLEANQQSAALSRFSLASFRGAEFVRGLGMDGNVLHRWMEHRDATIAAQAVTSERGSALVAISKVVRMGVQVAILGTGATLAVEGLISPGVMMAAMIIMGRALQPVEQAVANWKKLSAARAAYRRLEDLFAAVPDAGEAMALPDPVGKVELDGAVIGAGKSRQPVLRGVSFTLEPGAQLAIIGPSGSGKSSLARTMAGIWEPIEGTIRLDGASLSQWDPEQLGSFIGYLPQDIDFFPASIAENIARLGYVDQARVVEAAEAAGVHAMILRLPKGYNTLLGEGGVTLSGGQRQRLALARAIYGNPRLLILDEPNANLDADGEQAFYRALAVLKARKCTVVVVTHKPNILHHSDYIAVLGDGGLRYFGKRDEVLSRFGGPKVASLRRPPSTPTSHVAATA